MGMDNIFIFGMTVDEVEKLHASGYDAMLYYNSNPELKQVRKYIVLTLLFSYIILLSFIFIIFIIITLYLTLFSLNKSFIYISDIFACHFYYHHVTFDITFE